MRTKIFLDKKLKCDLPGDITAEKFFPIFRVYYFENWKSLEIRKEDKK